MRDFEAMNEVWNAFFSECAPPTRTTVAVRALPGHNFVEMKAVAARPLGGEAQR
jgi:enamine deaminase RidA (YjgF/YER057c/UK114 family)